MGMCEGVPGCVWVSVRARCVLVEGVRGCV